VELETALVIETLRTVRIVSRRDETPDIATFELRADDGPALPGFEAGAHIDVEVKPGLLRQYSLCDLPNGANSYRIGVLRDPKSRGGSIAMHARARGDCIRISTPRNHFPLVGGTSRTLLLAGGIGITPLLAMAQQLHQSNQPFEMHYCVRSTAQAAFQQELRSRSYRDRVRLHLDDGDPSQKLDIDALLAVNGQADLYVCGPAGFIGWIAAAAERAGLGADRFHREYFKPDPAAPVGEDGAFSVNLVRAGKTIEIAAGKSILVALQDHGIALPKSCESGVCGTCLTKVLGGIPEHRDYYLNESEKARGDQILPCCSRSRSALLVLDL
jgi:vanillate O-demethylase ferredoxin subunit